MPKKPAHEVVIHLLLVHVQSHQSSGADLSKLLVHISAIQVLCEVLKEMFIPEEHRLHIGNELLSMLLNCNSQNPDPDLMQLLSETIPEIEG